MKTTTLPFALKEWRERMGLTQEAAARLTGMSLPGWKSAEYRTQDRPGAPCNATLAKLCDVIEAIKLGKSNAELRVYTGITW